MSDENAATTADESEGRPFGYIAPEGETALVCESDAAVRDKIVGDLKNLNYAVAVAGSAREALKFMRFHIFNAIFINESFDTPAGEVNGVLRYLEGLSMTVRRKSFIVMISATLKTMDNMMAYNRSVNLIVNKNEINDIGHIFTKSLEEYDSFYHIYRENLRKEGKV